MNIKSYIKQHIEKVKKRKIDEESASADAGAYSTPFAFKKKKNINELLIKLIREELINEVSYNKFKNEVKFRTKSEALYKAIREVKNKLNEVDRIIDYTSRLKQELNEDEEGAKYWKRSINAVNKISEISNKISNKIKDIYQ